MVSWALRPMNLPNTLTVTRIFLVPLLVVVAYFMLRVAHRAEVT